MRGQKVKAIKRAARKINKGINPESSDMNVLKKYNRNNPIPNIKLGNLFMEKPASIINNNIFFSDKVKVKTVGNLSKQLRRQFA